MNAISCRKLNDPSFFDKFSCRTDEIVSSHNTVIDIEQLAELFLKKINTLLQTHIFSSTQKFRLQGIFLSFDAVSDDAFASNTSLKPSIQILCLGIAILAPNRALTQTQHHNMGQQHSWDRALQPLMTEIKHIPPLWCWRTPNKPKFCNTYIE